ncbi:DUF924 family protein [Derxia lacustris]|uniref:DUF924 family protein n=1 Tax=Derxia lacustris TaxID=764842 RepID=UPI000A16FFC3|nr:DUF924 family protein [Derxia lacustris]
MTDASSALVVADDAIDYRAILDPLAESVLRFWFIETGPDGWFLSSPPFDDAIRARFGRLHAAVAAGECEHWRHHPRGRLAEVIVLDQLSRNMFRDTPAAFAFDGLALALAQEAVRQGDDRKLGAREREFIYMPYMHSESRRIHEEAVRLFSQPFLETRLYWEKKHKAIVDRFGRYPHRNAILGRESTEEEIAFLKLPGSGF